MELKLTYTADGVELRKDDRCPRPATTADLVPGQGTSAPRVPTSSPEHVNATVVEPTEHHGIPAAPYRRSRAPPCRRRGRIHTRQVQQVRHGSWPFPRPGYPSSSRYCL